VWTDFITEATECRADLEGDEGTEGLLVGFVETLVAVAWGTFEETSYGYGEL
jgi:hypothetical protein